MAITIADPKLIAELEAVRGPVEFRDPNGKLLTVMTTNLPGAPPPEVMARLQALTPEELERRRKDRTGKTLEEILEDFRARGICT
jgi:hypothetical protein